MPDVSFKHRARRRIVWFDVGAGVFFVTVGLLLLDRGLWHTIVHHDLMLRNVSSGILSCTLGSLLAMEGLKSRHTGRRRLRGKISKRHRGIRLWVFLLLALAPLARAQAIGFQRSDGSRNEEHSSGCELMPVDQRKIEAWKARARRTSDRARSESANSAERERKLGERLAREMEKNTQFSSDPKAQEYVTGVVQRLATESEVGTPFTVKLIRTDDVNVFSLPGGFLYVTTGLIRSTESEAQLAGLLGHEIAHVLARHGSRQRRKQSILNWVSRPLMFVGPVGILARQMAGITMPLKFSRDAELEADVIGIDLLVAANYDPSEYVYWLTSSAACNPGTPSKFERLFDSYPVFQERLSLIESRIKELPRGSALIVSTSEFEEVRSKGPDGNAPQLLLGTERPILKRR